MVQFKDSSIKAQMGLPDMKLPIQYAFAYPERLTNNYKRLDFSICQSLTFEQPDLHRFRNLALAFEAMDKGGNMPCIINAANEIVVAAFLQDKIGFLSMSDVIEKTMEKCCFIKNPSYDDYVNTDKEARLIATELLN
jgi:1-deoxy-D-xylulose-5-phosphate reductoisomerase